MRKIKIALLFFIIIPGAIVLLHKPLIRACCYSFLHKQGLVYDSLDWEEGQLVLKGLSVKHPGLECTIDSIGMTLHVDWRHLKFLPHIEIIHPELLIGDEKGASSFLPLLYRSSWIKPSFTVHHGVLQLQETRLYYALVPKEGALNQFILSSDPDLNILPLLRIEIMDRGAELSLEFEIDEKDLKRSAALARYFFPDHPYFCTGEMRAEGEVLLDSHFGLKEFTCRAFFQDVDALYQTFSLQGIQGEAQCFFLPGRLQTVADFSSKQGKVGGQATFLFSQEGLEEVQLQDIALKDIHFTKKNFEVEAQELLIPRSHIAYNALLQSEIHLLGARYSDGNTECHLTEAHIMKNREEWLPSSCKGKWKEALFEIAFLGSEEDKSWELSYDCDLQQILPQIPKSIPTKGVARGVWQDGTFSCLLDAVLFQDRVGGHLQWEVPAFDLFVGEVPSFKFKGGQLHAPSLFLASYFPQLQGSVDVKAELESGSALLRLKGQQIEYRGLSLPVLDSSFILYKEGVISFSFPIKEASYETVFPISCEMSGSFDVKASPVVEGRMTHLTFPINKKTTFEEGKISWTLSSSQLKIDVCEGKWKLADETALTVKLRPFQFPFAKQICQPFTLSFFAGRKEMGRLEGIFRQQEVILDKTSHIAQIPLDCAPICLNQPLHMDIKSQVPLEEIPNLVSLYNNMGFGEFTLPPVEMKGLLKLHVIAGQNGKVAASCADLVIQGTQIPPLQTEMRYQKGNWQVDRFQVGTLALKATLIAENEGFRIQNIEGKQEGLAFRGNAYFRDEKLGCSFENIQYTLNHSKAKAKIAASLQCNADLSGQTTNWLTGQAHLICDLQEPALCTLSNDKVLLFSYGGKEGLKITSPRFTARSKSDYVGEFVCSQIVMPKWGFFSLTGIEGKAVSFLDTPFTWDGEVTFSGDAHIKPDTYAFQGVLGQGRYGWKDYRLSFEQIQCFLDPNTLHLRMKTAIEEQPLFSTLQIKREGELYGTLLILDHPKASGLKTTFRSVKGKWQIDSITGNCCGVTANVALNAKKRTQGVTPLSGTVSCDVQKVLPLLTKKQLHIDSIYHWTGDLFLCMEDPQKSLVQGALHAEEFSLLGYKFAKMQATTSGYFEKLSITNGYIEEGTLRLKIPHCEISKKQQGYYLHIPTLSLENLQPSALRKVRSAPSSLKPFKIEKCTLANIQGKLDDIHTWQAEGMLTFVNQFKKESSLFDFPLEMIKKMGLDLGVLTPVQGEVALEWRGSKFYLLSLDKSFSDLNRSSFYLAASKEPSYIDLFGNMHIDLKMHQDTVLKVIEPFTLTIRGTLDKPRYGLQF
ncbi:MAG: hypothetical protein RLZZ453_1060 [Chlamydiota bacterium]|jgi:hypothetical protein